MPVISNLRMAIGGYILLLACQDPAGHIGAIAIHAAAQNQPAAPAVTIDTALYDQQCLYLVHNRPSAQWPVKAGYPLEGAVLPFKRVVAFYGNLYAPAMGILGQLPLPQLKVKIQETAASWEKADPRMPVQPALHYIAVTAQRSPGKGNKYRLRMPDSQIDKVLAMADSLKALVFLDIQPGHSTVQEEIPALAKYLQRPGVHLGIDPEYSMKGGQVPCSVIGTLDAAAINYSAQYLDSLVQEYHLPPKILVVHRFTKAMVTNYKRIETRPGVQIVMNMDGFGFPAKKKDSYDAWIAGEPVQFTGFKLFYKQDVADKRWPTLMSPASILQLYPKPIYIQYQ